MKKALRMLAHLAGHTAGAVKQKNIIKAMEYNITARRKGQENECENYRQNREIYYL